MKSAKFIQRKKMETMFHHKTGETETLYLFEFILPGGEVVVDDLFSKINKQLLQSRMQFKYLTEGIRDQIERQLSMEGVLIDVESKKVILQHLNVFSSSF